MFMKPEEFAKSSLNSVLFFANTAFEGIERLTVLNLAAARSMLEASIANMSALMGAKDIQSFVELQKGMAAPSLEKAALGQRVVTGGKTCESPEDNMAALTRIAAEFLARDLPLMQRLGCCRTNVS